MDFETKRFWTRAGCGVLFAVCAAACLPIIHEEQRDLSDFEVFELDHGEKDGLSYRVIAEDDATYLFTVRFEGEFVSERSLTDAELQRLREASKSVTLHTAFYSGQPCCAEPSWILFIRWDEVRADTWWGYDSEFYIEENDEEVFFQLMESFRAAGEN